ncbi:MAG: LPS assembly lipoprotein LptE [Proteobacteria bacterium]|nr:LPS assembly lipoprotein LptE [Pseudomonadota bacterium]
MRQSIMPLRTLLVLILTGLLGACGFQLRGAYVLPFDKIYIGLPETNELHAQLKRSITTGSNARVIEVQKDAQATLLILDDKNAKNILSLAATGQAREFQLVRSFTFRLVDAKGRDWVPRTQIEIHRDISFSDNLVLSKYLEEALLWRDIQLDLVQQLMRRLAASKPPLDVTE